LWVVH